MMPELLAVTTKLFGKGCARSPSCVVACHSMLCCLLSSMRSNSVRLATILPGSTSLQARAHNPVDHLNLPGFNITLSAASKTMA